MFRVCFGRGTRSEPINLEVFVPHKRPGGEAGEDAGELEEMGRRDEAWQ